MLCLEIAVVSWMEQECCTDMSLTTVSALRVMHSTAAFHLGMICQRQSGTVANRAAEHVPKLVGDVSIEASAE